MSSANYMFVSAISVWRKLFTNVSYVFWRVYEGLGIKMQTEMGDGATQPPAVLAFLQSCPAHIWLLLQQISMKAALPVS